MLTCRTAERMHRSPCLAVLPFVDSSGTSERAWLEAALSDLLTADLSTSRFVRPLLSERARRLSERLPSDASGPDEAAVDALLQRSGLDGLLHGTIHGLEGNQLRLQMQLYRAGEPAPILIEVEGELEEAYTIVDEATVRVKKELGLSRNQLSTDKDRPSLETLTGSLDALRLYEVGLSELRAQQPGAAEPLLRRATALDPEFVMAQVRLAQCLAEIGSLDEARGAATRAWEITESRELPEAQRFQVGALVAQIRAAPDREAENLEQLSRLFPQDPEVRRRLALAYETAGRLQKAMEAYTALVRLEPGDDNALLDLAHAQWASGNAELALATLEPASGAGRFQNEPKQQGRVYHLMGLAFRDLGRFEEAESELVKALEIYEEAPGGSQITLRLEVLPISFFKNATKLAKPRCILVKI